MIKNILTTICVVVCLIAFNTVVNAQDSVGCACKCPRPDYHAPIGVMIDHGHPKGEWMVSYRTMNMIDHGNLSGNRAINNEQVYQFYLMSMDKMLMSMHNAMIMYGVSNRISIMAMSGFQYSSMEMSMFMSGGHNHGGIGGSQMKSKTFLSGITDPELYALVTILDRPNHQILLAQGVSLPLGSINQRNIDMMGVDRKNTYSLQLGSGTLDILSGITYTGQSDNYSWGGQINSDIKTSYNKNGYRLGNRYSFTSWFSRNWNNWISNSIRINSDCLGKIKGFDPEIAIQRSSDQDADTFNSGFVKLSLLAGVNFLIPSGTFSGNRFGLEAGLPFYQYVNGIQMKSGLVINAGWQYTF